MNNMNSMLALNNPVPFPTLKQDKRLRTFTPIILFHEHTYKNAADASNVQYVISQNDEHHSEFVRSWKKRVDEMLQTNSQYWLIVSENSKEYEKYEKSRRREMIYHRSLANSIYTYSHPQDQIENLAMKPKRRRGNLPKATTALLKDWLSQHRKHPYPTEEEKHCLARETKLSLQQISNWFINARRRHLPHLLESDYATENNSMNPTQSPLDIYSYEASDNSDDSSDAMRRITKCPTRINNKTGGVKKPYMRPKRKSSGSSIIV